jgi:uncharacterized protein YukE
MRPLLQRSIRANAFRLAVLTTGLLFALTALSSGQSSDAPSLGDLARKQRQKQPQSKDAPAKPKKVVTNEDIPERPSSDSSAKPSSSANDGSHGDASVESARDVMHTGEHWKGAIQQQKNAVADLKSHIEKLQDSIHFVEANRYRNGVEYNKVQAGKQQEVERLQSQLDEQKKNLEQMQEAARRAGFGSSVWDP